MATKSKTFFQPQDVVYTYTSNQAIADGILFDLGALEQFKTCPVNIVTTNLMGKGYLSTEDAYGNITPNIANLMDLTFQIVKYICSKAPDSFYALSVQLPSGVKQKIFVAENETGKFTAMLPEDY